MSHSKMSARERIDYLLDDRTFVELGSYVSARNTDFNLGAKKVQGDGVITGYGILQDRMVYLYSQDASALGGSVGEMHARKISALYDMAMKTGAPVIGMIDCAGLRLQEAFDGLAAFGEIFKKQVQASGMVPQISAVFGMCGGGSAVMTGLSDFTLMVKEDASLFINSPNALEGNSEDKENTADSAYQAEKAGNVDFVCDSETELLDTLRSLMEFLPSDFEAEDAFDDCEDDLNRIIALTDDMAENPAALLKAVADRGNFLEIKSMYAGEMVTGLMRLNGETVGVAANRGSEGDLSLTVRGLEKAAGLIRFCDAFSIPVLTVTNTEGLKANAHEERRMISALSRFTKEIAGATVPRINLITGKCYGTAGLVMNSKSLGADFVLAWPTASVGMMDPAQAIRIIYADEIDSGEGKVTLIAEKTQEYEEMQSSPAAAAGRGYIDDIIEPDATRKRLIAAFEMLFGKKETRPAKKHSAI